MSTYGRPVGGTVVTLTGTATPVDVAGVDWQHLGRIIGERDATIERVKALAASWEQEAPTCPCGTCRTNRNHAERIRAALRGTS